MNLKKQLVYSSVKSNFERIVYVYEKKTYNIYFVSNYCSSSFRCENIQKPSGPKVKNLITDKDAISIYHRWTIYFENEFNLDDFDNIDIKVQDSQNNDVDVIIQTDNAMQRIFVSPPEEGYKEGEKYTITVTH